MALAMRFARLAGLVLKVVEAISANFSLCELVAKFLNSKFCRSQCGKVRELGGCLIAASENERKTDA